MEHMARKDDPDDIESLLAEAERTLSGGGARPPARREEGPVERSGGRVRTAAVSAAVAGGAVWVLFALLPFLRATSGAVGAFLATFAVLLVLGVRRR
jgi:hypothetical protein